MGPFNHLFVLTPYIRAMSKMLIVGAAAMVGTTAIVVGGYVSPAAPSAIDIPAVILNMPPEIVLARLQSLTAEKYIVQLSGKEERFPAAITPSTVRISDDVVRFAVSILDERIIEVDTTVSLRGDRQTEVDVQARLPDSQFSDHDSLHPYDLKAIAAIADLVVTDYVDSVLRGKRMASEQELQREILGRLGFSEKQAQAFGKRIEMAFRSTYGEDIAALEDAEDRDEDESPDWAEDDAYRSLRSAGEAAAAAGAAADQAAAAADAAAAGTAIAGDQPFD
jgi:hypothetical protein